MMNFYISDLHVFCKSQTKQGNNWDNRPFETVEEMNQYIMQRWNTRVLLYAGGLFCNDALCERR